MSTINHKELPKKEEFTSKPDRWLFMLIFLLGVLGIFYLKRLQFNQFIVTLFPVALMIGYFIYLNFSKKFLLRDDRAGDNLYYLGFLFTLTSLAISLYVFSDDENSLALIISNFGIALATTITGLALRIFHLQLRQDPIEIERITHQELSKTAIKVRGELQSSLNEFENFRKVIAQKFSEAIKEITNEFKTEMNNTIHNFSDSCRELNVQVNSVFNSLDDGIRTLNVSNENLTSSINNIVNQFNKIDVPEDIINSKFDSIFNNLRNKISGISTSVTNINKRYKDFSEKLDNSNDVLNVFNNNISGLNNILKTIQNIVTGLEDSNKEFSTLTGKIKTQTKLYSKMEPNLSRLLNTFNDIDKISTELGNIQKEYNSIRISLEKTSFDIKNIKTTISLINSQNRPLSQLNEVINNTSKSIMLLNKSTKTFNQDFDDWYINLNQNRESLKQCRMLFQEELKKSSDITNKMHSALSSLSDAIISKLNAN